MRIFLVLMLIVTVFGCDILSWGHKKIHSIQNVKQVRSLKEIRTIKDVQLVLRMWNYYKGPVNGRPSSALTHAIKEFQKDNVLVVDGEVGAKTKAKLNGLIEKRNGSI